MDVESEPCTTYYMVNKPYACTAVDGLVSALIGPWRKASVLSPGGRHNVYAQCTPRLEFRSVLSLYVNVCKHIFQSFFIFYFFTPPPMSRWPLTRSAPFRDPNDATTPDVNTRENKIQMSRHSQLRKEIKLRKANEVETGEGVSCDAMWCESDASTRLVSLSGDDACQNGLFLNSKLYQHLCSNIIVKMRQIKWSGHCLRFFFVPYAICIHDVNTLFPATSYFPWHYHYKLPNASFSDYLRPADKVRVRAYM